MNGEYSLADIAAATGNGGGGNNGNGFGGDGSWWIILFLIFAAFGGWGNNGNGFGGGGSQGATSNYILASDFATIQRQLSDGFNGIEKGLDTIRNGLCDGFYENAQLINSVNMNVAGAQAGITNAITTNGYENRLGQQMLGQQISNCCCDLRQQLGDVNYNLLTQANMIGRQIERGFAETNYNMATQNCATLQAIDKVGDRVLDYLSNEKMQTLRDENQALRLAASQQAQNAFLIDQLGVKCPQPAYVVQPPQQVTFPTNCCGTVTYASNGCCGCGV